MNPDHDRTLLLCRRRAGPDVQIKTVFAFVFGTEIAHCIVRAVGLYAPRTEFERRAATAPALNRLWRAPAQYAKWRTRIGNALEGANVAFAIPLTGQAAGFNSDVFKFHMNFLSWKRRREWEQFPYCAARTSLRPARSDVRVTVRCRSRSVHSYRCAKRYRKFRSH